MVGAIFYGGRIGREFLSRSMFENTFRIETRNRLSCTEIYHGLCNLINGDDVLEMGRADSTSWNVTISNPEAAAILRSISTITIGNRTCKMVNVSRQTINVRVHWLPGYVEDTLLYHLFKEYGKVVSVTRETTILDANTAKRNGVRTVLLETDDLMKGQIPHLFTFEGGISALVTMAGRPPLCLKCHTVGHVRRDCPGAIVRSQPHSYSEVLTTASTRNREQPPRPAPAAGTSSAAEDVAEAAEVQEREELWESEDDSAMIDTPLIIDFCFFHSPEARDC